MCMKILDIIIICNSGIQNITCDTLPASSRYKILKLKNVLSKAFEKIQSLEKNLLEASGIQDMQSFESEIKELREKKSRTIEEDEKYKEMSDKMDDYLKVRTEMLNDTMALDDIRTISYEDWHNLRKENRPKDDKEILSNYIEDVLKGVFWEEPDE